MHRLTFKSASKNIVFWCVLLFTAVLLSCNNNANKKNADTVSFTINKSLLSNQKYLAPNESFSVYPPKDWNRIEAYDSEIGQMLSNQLDSSLLAMYVHDASNCMLIITDMSKKGAEFVEAVLKAPDTFYNKDSTWIDIQSSNFEYKSYTINQIVFQNADLVVFKLFIHSLSELYELDYIVPRAELNNFVKSVESSIGSIN